MSHHRHPSFPLNNPSESPKNNENNNNDKGDDDDDDDVVDDDDDDELMRISELVHWRENNPYTKATTSNE